MKHVYIVNKKQGNTSKAIGKQCRKCGKALINGDIVVSTTGYKSRHGKLYHTSCFETLFID